MNEHLANRVFDVLVEECGANPDLRRDFVRTALDNFANTRNTEFRFQGALGFGGKAYGISKSWYVSCYPEDRNPDRDARIARANTKLLGLLPAVVREPTGLGKIAVRQSLGLSHTQQVLGRTPRPKKDT